MGNETNIVYDDLGRKTLMDDTYMGHWEYEYDENGNLIGQKDANLNEVSIIYDELNRIDLKTYYSDNRVVDYIYDEEDENYYNIGSLTTIETKDNDVTTSVVKYNYDKMGRKVNEVRTIDSVDYVIEREYDLAGRLDYIIYPDNTQYDYTYHSMGYLEEVRKDGADYAFADFSEHNALGQVEYMSYGNGTGTQYEYYVGNFRLENMKTTLETPGDIQNLSYEYDNVGNVTGIIDGKNSVNHTFVYDEVNRLTTATATGGSDPSRLYNQGYNHDLAGNMTSKTGIGGWEVLAWQDSQKHIRPTAVAFDGEVAGVGERVVDYNQDNKPTYIEYNGQGTYLYYDGEGNRIKKISNGETVIYVGGLYEISGGEAISYIFANGQKIVTLTDDHEYYTHTDHLGSTTIVTDENGDAVEEIGYLPFGATLFRNVYNGGQWESAYRFTQQEFDNEYHLYNYNARLYDPIMCRFITADTMVPDWTNPQSLNRYSYCVNNPLIYVDQSGHFWFAVLIGALIGGGVSAATGGNILQGVLCGAIGGAIFSGAGVLAHGKDIFTQAMIHAGGGAISGGINAVITGGNIFQGMAIGAFSAGVAKGFNIQNLPGRMAVGSLSGGIAAELAGGSFADGAFQGAWTSAFAYWFNDMADKFKRTFYDRFADDFLEEFRETAPLEHDLFKEYAEGLPADFEDFRDFVSAWKDFDPFARTRAEAIFKDPSSFYKSAHGPLSWIGRGLHSIGLSIISEALTAQATVNYIEITTEAFTIRMQGPQVFNENTFIEAFGRPYDYYLK